MTITYEIFDENENYQGSFNKYDNAVDFAQEMADELKKDMFIFKVNTELIKCVTPD